MKKEFIDYMYEFRSEVQKQISRLVELNKQPIFKCCDNMEGGSETHAELLAKRS